MTERKVEPFAVAQMVERYVESEIRDAEKFSNRDVLDDSGVYGLHQLAADVYALGFNEGVTTEGWRQLEARRRAREITRTPPGQDQEDGGQ